MSAVSAFYQYQARNGVDVGELLATWQLPGRRSGWKPFLHHIGKGTPQPRRAISLKAPAKIPRVLTTAEMQALLDACDRLRDRFPFALMHDSGVRVGEALGLRHEDIAVAEREVTVVRRLNANGARSKSRDSRTIPVSAGLIRLYADYLHLEYGPVGSDFMSSSTCGAGGSGGRCPTLRSMTWCCGSASGPGLISIRIGAGIRWPPGCCGTGCRSRSSPRYSVMFLSPPRCRSMVT
jgi:integrase